MDQKEKHQKEELHLALHVAASIGRLSALPRRSVSTNSLMMYRLLSPCSLPLGWSLQETPLACDQPSLFSHFRGVLLVCQMWSLSWQPPQKNPNRRVQSPIAQLDLSNSKCPHPVFNPRGIKYLLK